MLLYLPHVNAALNSLAALLLLVGYVRIRQGRELAHRNLMLASFVVSIAFLVSYGFYHVLAGHVAFPSYPPPGVRIAYLVILFSHIVLAATVPILALVTIGLGLAGRRQAHRRIARWTFPIWLYVSVTGVLVYLLLYQIFPPRAETTRIWPEATLSGERASEPGVLAELARPSKERVGMR
jgi:uncharacterized membrane protein YozB (DUF420 family)